MVGHFGKAYPPNVILVPQNVEKNSLKTKKLVSSIFKKINKESPKSSKCYFYKPQ